jgi:hypothetical protein
MTKPTSASIIEDKFNMRLLTKPVFGRRHVFFLGQHYNGKEECFDVGAANMVVRPIRVTRRHHKTKGEALVTWEYICKALEEMEKRPNEEDRERKVVIGRN